MTCTDTNGTSLGQLQAPRRNRYFYGKLLDVLHLTMEQQYGLAASAHLNRVNFGPGVLCGLEVAAFERDGEHGLTIGAGVALDGVGRRIVVPDDVELLPLELTDNCGMPLQPQPDVLPAALVLSVCYRECEADFAPALVADPVCDGSRRCEAGTLVESYSLVVHEGTPAAVSHACRDEVIAKLKAGDAHAALCALAAECPDTPADTCVALATITVGSDESLTVPDACATRPIVPTNRALLELITCLAQRIDECCGSNGDDPIPDPTPTTETFRIDDLVVGNRAGTEYHKLSGIPPGGAMTMSYTEESGVIDVLFNGVVDESSVLLDTNVEVVDSAGTAQAFDQPKVLDGGKRLRLELSAGTVFPVGDYTVSISGEPPNPLTSDTGDALDAELTQLPTGEYKLPTGDGTAGGTFSAKFTVQ